MSSPYVSVRILCPLSERLETVYFYPTCIGGVQTVDINGFNGCDNGWCNCRACTDCKAKAYKKIHDSE